MRLHLAEDKKLQSNLRTLLLCSRFKTIKLTTLADEYSKKQASFLDGKDNLEYRLFLEQAYIDECNRKGEPIVTPISTSTLVASTLPKDYPIPGDLKKCHEDFESLSRKIQALIQQEEEQYELRNIILENTDSESNFPSSAKKVDLKKLNYFLNDKEHSLGFKRFAENMQKDNPYLILLKYKQAALKFAKEHEIENQSFRDKLDKTFVGPEVSFGLKKEFRRKFAPLGAKVATISLVTLLSLNGLAGIVSPDRNITNGTVEPHTSQTEVSSTVAPTNTPSFEPDTNPNIDLPISNSITIDSYASAAKDFLQKTAEVYKYNTNQEIDLSHLNYDNYDVGNTTIYIAKLGNQTLRFSTLSNHTSNSTYLKKALESAGAEILETYNSRITWITNNEGNSIAICDSKGNPIRSGKVLEGENSQYIQSYVQTAKNIMANAGIDSSGKSEAELIGYYLFNGPSAQNDELSKALGETQSLANYQKGEQGTFRSGKEDSYAIYLYSEKSNKWANDFNNKALTVEGQSTDGMEIGD